MSKGFPSRHMSPYESLHSEGGHRDDDKRGDGERPSICNTPKNKWEGDKEKHNYLHMYEKIKGK